MEMELDIRITPAGEIIFPWWSEEIKKIICSMCVKQNCEWCLNANPYCG